MEFENRDDFIVKRYQQDEQTMIRLFVKWCLNHQLDPLSLYKRAYPQQSGNPALKNAIEEADADELEISNGTLLEVLQLFGNDDLAFVVAEEIEKLPGK